MKTRVRSHVVRIFIAGLAVLVVSGALLEHPGRSRGAGGAAQPSNNIAVVPGFAPKPYPHNSGVPPLPVFLSQLAKYHFSQLPAASVTTAALKGYDTVILYGIRWSDIPSAGQLAINNFAHTHKVVIWDADATGAQAYSSFVQPFSTLSSGQGYQGKPSDSVVYFPTPDFLASSNPASPDYLDPAQLVHDKDELNDMNAMKSGTSNWRPALRAANHGIPAGAWPVAWSYGVIGDHTGLTIYSGLDADAFPTQETLNNDRRELALDLAAPFSSTPDPSCAPGCHLPNVKPGPPFASCGFASVSHHWGHGRLPVVLKTSLASGITVQILNRSGHVLAKRSEQTGDLVPLVIPTKKLPSDGSSRLRAVVFVDGETACTNPFQLVKVNHARPRLLLLATSRAISNGTRHLVTLRVSEKSWMKVVAPHVHWRTNPLPANKVKQFSLPGSVRNAKLILHDRAGNTVVRRLVWAPSS